METAQAAEEVQGAGSLDWTALGGQQPAAQEAAAAQARLLARALAAHGIIMERDAAPEEFEDRLEAVLDTLWPKARALEGYGLQSSLGAYTVTKVAFDLVPAGRTGLRHEPLTREGLGAALVEHGIDEVGAVSVLGDWPGRAAGAVGDPEGLSPSTIAGLAERTLTRGERAAALDQVSVSPRCLNRLASALNLLSAVRALLPLLPPEDAGRDATVAVVGLALGRPDRVAQLYEARTRTLRAKGLHELAVAQWALLQSQAPELEADPLVCAPPAAEAPVAAARADTEVTPTEDGDDDDFGGDDDDDVLEIVEERADPEAPPFDLGDVDGPPRPARWGAAEDALELTALQAFADALCEHATLAARSGGLLGVAPTPAPATVPRRPCPPDERVLRALEARAEGPSGDEEMTERITIDPLLHGHRLEVEGLPYDPLFPPVRGALRAICAAAEGEPPATPAIEAGGDLAWVLARARALALLVQGDLTEAQRAVASFGEAAAPEGRWAKDRAVRFSGRATEPVDPREARPVAAALVADLIQQLARTMAGTAGGR